MIQNKHDEHCSTDPFCFLSCQYSWGFNLHYYKGRRRATPTPDKSNEPLSMWHKKLIFFFHDTRAQLRPKPLLFEGFRSHTIKHTHTHTHPFRLPWTTNHLFAEAANFTTQNKHNGWTSVPSVGFLQPRQSRVCRSTSQTACPAGSARSLWPSTYWKGGSG